MTTENILLHGKMFRATVVGTDGSGNTVYVQDVQAAAGATDQSTPGTTDLVTDRYTRPVVITGTFTPGASYTGGQCMGGKITLATGLAAGTKVRFARLVVNMVGTLTATANLHINIFDSNPSASTFTDAGTFAIAAADLTKWLFGPAAGITTTANTGAANWVAQSTHMPTATVDASGNLYLGMAVTGTFTLTSPSASWRLEVLY